LMNVTGTLYKYNNQYPTVSTAGIKMTKSK
jgi:hypothetical protein